MELGRSVTSLVSSSLWNLIGDSVELPFEGLIYRSVWRSVDDLVNDFKRLK